MKEMVSAFVKLDNAECPFCSNTLVLEEAEVNVTSLNRDGTIKSFKNAAYNPILRCPICKEKFPAVRIGIAFTRGAVTSSREIMTEIQRKKTNPFME